VRAELAPYFALGLVVGLMGVMLIMRLFMDDTP